MKVKATFLIEGGHQIQAELEDTDPILHFIAGANKESTLIEIIVEEGQGAVYLDSNKIVAFITHPPMNRDAEFAQQTNSQIEVLEHSAKQGTSEQAVSQQRVLAAGVEPSKVLHKKSFLNQSEYDELLAYVLKSEKQFVGSSVDAKDRDYRRSLVLHQFPKFSAMMIEKVKACVPEVTEFFNIPCAEPGHVECQLTASKDNHFYKMHNDNGSSATSGRWLTYVYYFNKSPKAFTGGDLRLYDTVIRNNYYVAADSYQDIEPIDNSIIFFLPRYMHEVLPVTVPSKKFEDSRFTINGWLWLKA